MDFQKEIENWAERLKTERNGLKYFRQQIENDSDIPASIKTRFFEIIQSVKVNIHELRKECRDACKPQHMLQLEDLHRRLRVRYQSVLFSIEKLLSTAKQENQSEPGYAAATFASANRTSPPRRKQGVSFSSDVTIDKGVKSDFLHLKEEIVSLMGILKSHTHEDMQRQIDELKRENRTLSSSYTKLEAENIQLNRDYSQLAQKIDFIEAANDMKRAPIPEPEPVSPQSPDRRQLTAKNEARKMFKNYY